MKTFKQLIVVLFLTIPLYTFAQTGITGGVFDYDNKSFPLQKVTVRNLNNKETTHLPVLPDNLLLKRARAICWSSLYQAFIQIPCI
ncbi:hypothetical protein [Pedobacter sp. NJ-S-72]